MRYYYLFFYVSQILSRVDKWLWNPLTHIISHYTFKGEMVSNKGPIGCDSFHACPNESLPVFLYSPGIVDETKGAGEGLN